MAARESSSTIPPTLSGCARNGTPTRSRSCCPPLPPRKSPPRAGPATWRCVSPPSKRCSRRSSEPRLRHLRHPLSETHLRHLRHDPMCVRLSVRVSERLYLTVDEAAEYTGLGVGYLRRLVVDGKLQVVKGAGPNGANVLRRMSNAQLFIAIGLPLVANDSSRALGAAYQQQAPSACAVPCLLMTRAFFRSTGAAPAPRWDVPRSPPDSIHLRTRQALSRRTSSFPSEQA
jgi:excisionase family DNA binding protein